VIAPRSATAKSPWMMRSVVQKVVRLPYARLSEQVARR